MMTQQTAHRILFRLLLGGGILFVLSFFIPHAEAAILPPGNISTCGQLNAAGTYSLTAGVGSIGVTCFNITSAGVIINATTSRTILGNIVATSTGDGDGYSFSFTGLVSSTGINASGSGSGVGGTVTFDGTATNQGAGTITASSVVFNGSSRNNGHITASSTTFNESSYIDSSGSVINGNVKLNTTYYDVDDSTVPTGGVLIVSGSRSWLGTINGTVYDSQNNPITSYVFNGSSRVIGTINGTAKLNTTFYDLTGGIVPTGGILTVSGGRLWGGRINGTVYDSQNNPITSYVFNETSYNNGTITASSTTFNGSSYNASTITASSVVFNESSFHNGGTITASSTTFNGSSYITGTSFIIGDAKFNTTYYNAASSTVPTDGVLTVSGGRIWTGRIDGTVYDSQNNPITSYVFNGSSYNNYGTIIASSTVFNGTSYNKGIIIASSTIFNVSSRNNGTITASSTTFNGSSYNASTITASSVVFNESSFHNGGTITASSTTFNGSSYNASTITASSTTFNESSYAIAGSIINGNVKLNTTYYDVDDSTVPTGGVLTVSGGRVWSGVISGTVTGSDNRAITSYVFSGSGSYNSGTITGTVDVYFPATRPVGGTINGTVTYHGYPGLYYTNATGDEKWNTLNNWWISEAFSAHPASLPSSLYDIYLYASLTSITSGTASVQSATFYGGSSNGISLTASHGATFTSTSTNAASGTITGSATFLDDQSVNSGTVTESVTRQFTVDTSSTRNFTTDGSRNNWIVEAYAPIVDLSAATYSLSANVFHAFANSVFTPNPTIGGGAALTPAVSITSPASYNVVKWTPSIAWGNSTICEYKYDTDLYITITCSRNGTDIPHPTTAGTHTLYVKGTDSLGNLSERLYSFVYDNTSPVYTSCDTDLLDEPRTFYYLQGNVVGNCTVSINNTELRGALSTATVGYSVTGNIISNALSAGSNGLNLSLKGIAVAGSVSSNGGIGSIGVNGGAGGTINIATSTTGTVSTNGGNSPKNGGAGGTISIINSYAVAGDTEVSATGGSSTSCGVGGSGGTIAITDSSDYDPTSQAGTSANGSCSGGTPGGTSRAPVVVGTYVPPSAPSVPLVPVVLVSTPVGPGSSIPFIFGDRRTPLILPVTNVKSLFLPTLPTFGGVGKGAFSFESPIMKFIAAPLPASIIKALKASPQLGKYLASIGILDAQDLLNLRSKPLSLEIPEKKADIPDGLLMLSMNGTSLPLFAAYDSKYLLIQKGTVPLRTPITISLYPTTKGAVIGTIDDNIYTFKKLGSTSLLSVTFLTPAATGTYMFTTKAAPLSLFLEVVPQLPVTVDKVKKQSVWSVLKFW